MINRKRTEELKEKLQKHLEYITGISVNNRDILHLGCQDTTDLITFITDDYEKAKDNLDMMTKNRDYWFEKTQKAKAERDYWHDEQGNENRRWRQAEAELEKVKALLDAANYRYDELQGLRTDDLAKLARWRPLTEAVKQAKHLSDCAKRVEFLVTKFKHGYEGAPEELAILRAALACREPEREKKEKE